MTRDDFETLARNIAPEQIRAGLLEHDAEQREALATAHAVIEAMREVMVEEIRASVDRWHELQTLRLQLGDAAQVLQWYADQADGCRKLGSIGDPARQALDHDGGGRARECLARPAPEGIPAALLDLLAVIHRDGGHFVAQHGLEQAARFAESIVQTERAARAAV